METDKMAAVRAAKGAGLAKTTEERFQEATSGLSEAAARAIHKRLLEMPKTVQNGYLRAISGRSKPAGIKAHCLECVGWVRAEVTLCTAPACPLFPYRPFQA